MYISIDLYIEIFYHPSMDKFFALSDPTRREIISLLSDQKELSVNEILHYFPMSQPAISQHLKVLRDADLLEVEKRAQKRLYSLHYKGLLEIDEWIQKAIQQWNTRFDALERVLQREKLKKQNG